MRSASHAPRAIYTLDMEPSENRIESHGKQEANCRATLSDTSGHEKLPSGFFCKFNLCHTIAVDHAQELSNKHGWFCLLEIVEDPGVIGTRIPTGEVSQENTKSRVAHVTCAKAVVSTSKMLSVICLVETHRWTGRIYQMEYLCRPKQIAVLMILQSPLHKVNGRRAPGDLTMRPLSSTWKIWE